MPKQSSPGQPESNDEPNAPDVATVVQSYRALVQTAANGKFDGNGLRFATEQEAEEYAQELTSRWILVRDHRVEASADPVNYEMVDGRAKSVEAPTNHHEL